MQALNLPKERFPLWSPGNQNNQVLKKVLGEKDS